MGSRAGEVTILSLTQPAQYHVTFGQRRMSERESTEALLSTYEVDKYMGLMGLDIPNTPLQTQGGSGGSEALSLSK
jgi:hypothetical protein